MIEPERLGGIDRGHFDRALDWHARRIEMADVLHEHAHLNLLDHVHAVVDHRPIGAEGDIHARAPRISKRADAATANGFAGRRIDEAAADARHVLDIELCYMDAVNQDPMRVQQTELHQVTDISAPGLAKVTKKALLYRES